MIEGRLPGLNEIIGAYCATRMGGARQKKEETHRCMEAILMSGVPKFTGPVRIRIAWIEPNNRRDPDNIRVGSKFIFDALVEMGKLPGDSKRWIVGITDTFPEPEPKNPRIEVEIVEA